MFLLISDSTSTSGSVRSSDSLRTRAHISDTCTGVQQALLVNEIFPEIRLQARIAIASIGHRLTGMWDRRMFGAYFGDREPETLANVRIKYRLILHEASTDQGGEVMITCYYDEIYCRDNPSQLAYMEDWQNNYIILV